uniref:Uncharacterized protein n=1 Tax=Kalanchoe fedtschenkoi TaxID=63787 RepID=A0A7N0UZA0_KALFE
MNRSLQIQTNSEPVRLQSALICHPPIAAPPLAIAGFTTSASLPLLMVVEKNFRSG